MSEQRNGALPPSSRLPNASCLISPGSTIGILGGGQLGRMMAMAAAEMGYHVHIYCPEKGCPASEVARNTTCADYTDAKALEAFARSVDVITYEFENIPISGLRQIENIKPIRPGLNVLQTCQHRIREKEALKAMGIGTAPFAAVTSNAEFHAAVAHIGTPSILKTASMGYDGKGQWKVNTNPVREKGELGPESMLPEIAAQGGDDRLEFILEGFVHFAMEISVIAARDINGNTACYVPVHNIHKHHILSETIAPAPISEALAKKAEAIARTIADGLKLVGLMAVEMFVIGKDDILVNELAPRPHNSGHWTMDACVTSQFGQAIRAVCGLPLGNPARLCDARMLNLIGDEAHKWREYSSQPNAKVHLYGKKEARPGRKMGHVNLLDV